jgi:murein DD-endopeptidase MepM/ murein hydrolase activator NlpD
VPSQGNRRVKPGKGGRSPRQAAAPSSAEARAQRPTVKRKANRRIRGEAEGPRRAAADPMERKIRNRTILLLTLLALVNAYVFVWREGTSVLELAPAMIGGDADEGGHGGPLGSFASPPERACSGDPVRIFEGLGDQIFQTSALSSGRTLRLLLLEIGVEGAEIDALEAAIRPSLDLGLVAGSGAPVRVAMDRRGGVSALEIELAEGHLVQACKDGQGMQVRTIQHAPVSEVAALRLELGNDADLTRAVVDAGERPELAALIAEVLAFDLDLVAEAQPRDRVEVIVEKRSLGKSFHRYGALLAVRFRGAAGRFTYFRHQGEGSRSAAYYDAEGQPQRRTLLRSPLRYHALAPEARAMMPPSVEIVAGRAGALYRRPEGAPVVALGEGVVRLAEQAGDAGLVVELEFGGGLVARYAHLLRTLGDLRPGVKVRQGQLIGLAGHSGKTATDRVRLELWREAAGELTMQDPLMIARGDEARPAVVGASLAGKALERYKAELVPRIKALRQLGE